VASLKGSSDIVQDLINAGANVNAKTTDGGTAFMLAIDPNTREILKKAGAKE
jgi:ankyrin repeat protein